MGKNQNSVVVLWIWLKFWWMIPMGVKYNHTKFERDSTVMINKQTNKPFIIV